MKVIFLASLMIFGFSALSVDAHAKWECKYEMWSDGGEDGDNYSGTSNLKGKPGKDAAMLMAYNECIDSGRHYTARCYNMVYGGGGFFKCEETK